MTGTRLARPPGARTGDLRRGLPLRARAPRLPAGRRVRARGRARAPRARGAAPPRVRPRRLGRRRGVHLLRAPREAARDRQGAPARGDEPQALAIAKEVADETGALFAGDICNTNVFVGDDASRQAVRAMFEEQVGWAVEAGVDFVIGETFSWGEEALIALDVDQGDRASGRRSRSRSTRIPRRARAGRPRTRARGSRTRARTSSGSTASAGRRRCCRCSRRSASACPATSPRCPCRTARPTSSRPSSRCAIRTATSSPAGDRSRRRSTRSSATATRSRTSRARRSEIGVDYFGVCCGAGPHHIRAVAEALGRTPPASRFSPDMSKHAFLGTHERVPQEYKEYAEKL